MIHVVVATDERYVPWAATMMKSCLTHTTGSQVHFHVLHDGSVGRDSSDKIRRMVESDGGDATVEAVDLKLFEGLPTGGRFGITLWTRFFYADLLDADRALHLDADTLVMSSIEPLWDTPLGDAPLAAVPNVFARDKQAHVESLGLAPGPTYFNAGVMLMNLDLMRRERMPDELVNEMHRGASQSWLRDQDAFNVVFDGRWVHLHPRWNAQYSFWLWRDWAAELLGDDVVTETTTNPAVLHFEGPGPNKPWHYLSDHPRRDEYLRVLGQTPWAGAAPEDRTLSTRVIRRLPRAKQADWYGRLLRARHQTERARWRLSRRTAG